MIAALKDHATTVKTLIANGADINARDKDGFTALMGAAKNGCTTAVETLINNNANVNAKKQIWANSLGVCSEE